MFSLAPLLTCDACQRPLQPSWTATDERIYAFLCGCWREPITAVVIERVVRDRVAAESPMLVADATLDRLSGVLVGLFAEIRVGSSLTGVEFVWRI